MKDIERRRLDMFKRVRTFANSYRDKFSPTSLAISTVTSLEGVIGELEQTAALKTSTTNVSQQKTTNKSMIKDSIREVLEMISRTARVMAFDDAGFEQKFRLPKDLSEQQLLDTARAFLEDAIPLAAKFRDYEVPETFLDDLKEDIEAFEKVLAERQDVVLQRIESNASIDNLIDRGMKEVRIFDAIINNKFRDDVGILTAWTNAKHIERVGKKEKPDTPPSS